MIFAETPRLFLRALEKTDLPILTELIGDWDVCKWLLVVPHPYHLKNAEEFYVEMSKSYQKKTPQFFVVANKSDGQLMGGVGVHPPRTSDPKSGEVFIGYWLGKPYWGQGFMSETLKTVLALIFKRPDVELVIAMTDPANHVSKNILQKAGLKYLGIFPRTEPGLRGGPEVTRWELTRKEYENSASSS